MPNEKVLVGKITSTHGIKGQVKIMSFCHNPADIENYQPVFDKNNRKLKIKITSKAQGKNFDIFIANIEGINSANEAITLRNTELFIERKQLLENEDSDEFYYVDLIGLAVVNEENNKIGKVVDVMNYGAGDILEIEFTESFLQKTNEKEKIQMFSYREEVFPEINIEENFVKMIFPETIEIKEND